MIGKLLDYRYQVIKVLATGGFGRTYIAQDTKRPGNPICVVKHLKPTNSQVKAFETAKRLFQSEAETLEKLGNHDQIPRLLAYFDEKHEFYLVQEFVEGHPLHDELNPGEKWSEAQVIQLLQEILSVLAFVHSHGVIHRDIKPENIIRRAADGRLVLLDFGAVKQLRASYSFNSALNPSATVAIGTPGYMPTEQGQGKPRHNSDIYALGIIAIQALTGVAPMDLLEDPATGELLWEDLVPVSHELETVLSKMVRYHFKERYQSATEALEALEAFAPSHIKEQYPSYRYRELVYQPDTPESRLITIAVAPKNDASRTVDAAVKPLRRNGSPDFLQMFILLCLAGSAVAITPAVMRNAKNFAANLSEDRLIAENCLAVVSSDSNIRSEPSAIASETIVENLTKDTAYEVTGKRTQDGWVELKYNFDTPVWAYSQVIKNNQQWITCLRDKGVAVKTVDGRGLIATFPTVKPKPKSAIFDFGKIFSSREEPEISLRPPKENIPSPPPSRDEREIVEKARDKYESGDLQGAIALLKSLADNSSAGIKETTQVITQWQKDWQKAESLFNDINDALAIGDWDKVLDYQDNPEKLPDIDYWRDKINPLFKQAQKNSSPQSQQSKQPLAATEPSNQTNSAQGSKIEDTLRTESKNLRDIFEGDHKVMTKPNSQDQ